MFPLTIVLLLFGWNSTSAAELIKLDFSHLGEMLTERNLDVRSRAALVNLADTRTGHLTRSFLPQIFGELGAERFKTGIYPYYTQPFGTIGVSLNIFRGGRDFFEAKARISEFTVSEKQARLDYLKDLSSARKIYWNLVHIREVVSRVNEAKNRNEKNLQIANRRIFRGISTETDRLEFEIYRSELLEEITSQLHEARLLEIQLAALLGLSSDVSFDTTTRIDHVNDELLLASSFAPSSHLEYSLLRSHLDVAIARKSQANRWWVPTIDIFSSYHLYSLRDRDFLERSFRDDTVFGIKLSINFFDAVQLVEARTKSLEISALEHKTAQKFRDAQAEVTLSREHMLHDHELVQMAQARITQGKKYLTRTQEEYERGVKSTADILAAEQKVLDFERQFSERKLQYQLKRCDLLALIDR